MSKISLIIKREYISRVSKKSFLVMTILGPILMAALMIVPAWMSQMSDGVKTIAVLDEYHSPYCEGLFYKKFKETNDIKFDYIIDNIDNAKKNLTKNGYYAVLHLPRISTIPQNVNIYANEQVALNVKLHIENELEKTIEKLKINKDIEAELRKLNIDTTAFKGKTFSEISENFAKNLKETSKTSVRVSSIKINSETGKEEEGSSEVITVLAFLSGFMIYMFVFLFGAQVMRGVIEEKTSRIVEVIISSVKPFQLMMGKILGIALVGLTQFLLWVVLTFTIVSIVQVSFPGKIKFSKTEQVLAQSDGSVIVPNNSIPKDQINEILVQIGSINFPLIIGMFLFYFLGGYLFYSALFAAIGSAVDNETDTQQFMLPISLPLILGIVMIQFVINNPQGPVAFWMSIIPFTSPIIMMVRIPFGVPFLDLALSTTLLIIGIFFNTWLAAKIYRTGILMYGKKVNYRELWKWIKY
ncbi:MAG: ABC transporter permease [Bacteroidota bacterium]